MRAIKAGQAQGPRIPHPRPLPLPPPSDGIGPVLVGFCGEMQRCGTTVGARGWAASGWGPRACPVGDDLACPYGFFLADKERKQRILWRLINNVYCNI